MRKDKIKQLMILLGICVLPMIAAAFSGCGIKQSYSCRMCGSSTTYTPVYASGIADDGDSQYEYTSCVGPAGCIGFGCNTACWPTECISIKKTTTTGVVIYYDPVGCIGCSGESTSLSKGKYNDNVSCLGITCASSTYVEEINADKSVAYTTASCFGCTIGEKEYVNNLNLNNSVDRKFEHGCASACYEDNE